jgi:hypothetical protein
MEQATSALAQQRSDRLVRIDDVTSLLAPLPGVRQTTRDERSEWRHHRRLETRQLDEEQLAIRAEFRLSRCSSTPRSRTANR